MTSRTERHQVSARKVLVVASGLAEVFIVVTAVVAYGLTANPVVALVAIAATVRFVIGAVARIRRPSQDIEPEQDQRVWIDELTGLANMASLRGQLDQAVEHHRTSQRTGTLVVVNIQNFKSINDSYGGNVGDELILATAKRLRSATRGDDLVARMHGDEFAVLLCDVEAHSSGAQVAIGRIQAVLREPMDLGVRPIVVRVNVGYAGLAADVSNGEDLLRNATVALHVARRVRNGQNIAYESNMHADVLNKIQLHADLERALRDQELQLHFQPTVNIFTGRLDGVEALLRWPHPERGFVSPADFIPLAEESGLIIPIGNWVLQQACAQMRMWQGRYNAPELKVSVNLSARQLEQDDLVEVVRTAMEDSGIAPGSLVLEITESVLTSDGQATIAKMEALVELGCEFSIDDFGTGYSALSYLQKFPVSELKVDRSFVMGLGAGAGGDEEQLGLVQAIVDLARTLRLRTVAEGVETVGQLEAVKAAGCDVAQGFLLARPMPAEDVRRLIEATHAEGLPVPIS